MLLDPRFKNVSFVSSDSLLDELTETARNRSSVTTLASSRTPSSSATTSGTPVSRRQEGKLMKLLADIVHAPDDSLTDPSEKAKLELQRYLSDVITDQYDEKGPLDPLKWWQLNGVRYPCVSVLARKYLSIPATSVPSERAFSLTGHLVNEKRASMLPDTVNMLSFLANNSK